MPSENACTDYLPLAGYPILSISVVELSRRLGQRLAVERKTVLLFANTNFILQCQPMLAWLHGADVILVNDGVGLDIAASMTFGRTYEANLNGTDFLPGLLKEQIVRRKVFMYGGKPGVAEKAGQVIEGEFGQEVVGCMDGYTVLSPSATCDLINRTGAEIVLVAMGNPLQEAWIKRNMKALDASLLIGVGAWFDFLSGSFQRAPHWVRDMHCEWLFRLSHEPRRLLRRYTLDIGSFLLLCVRRGRT